MREICEKEVYVMGEICENMRDMKKNVYVMRDMKKNVYVMGERFMS